MLLTDVAEWSAGGHRLWQPSCQRAPSWLPACRPGLTFAGARTPLAECSMMHHALVAGDVLRPGAANLQSDETACCRSCLADDRCTAWVYCPNPAGCNASEAAAAAAAASSADGAAAPVRRDTTDPSPAPSPAAADEAFGATLFLPHRGCRLLSIPAFRLRKDSPQVVAKGEGVPYVSGGQGLRDGTPLCTHPAGDGRCTGLCHGVSAGLVSRRSTRGLLLLLLMVRAGRHAGYAAR